MRYFSTFSGIGGFELGIQQAYENLSFEKTAERVWQEDAEALRIQASSANNEGDKGLDSSGAGLQQHPDRSSVRQPTCVGFSEIDKYAIQIYEKHFGCTTHQREQKKGTGATEGQRSQCTNECTNRFNHSPHKNYHDITKINEEELPEFDLLVGGFPCQSFSIAGKRGGFSDTRGTLFFDIARILKAKQPRLLLLENVKGLLSHDEGRTFATIISTLDELGYDLQWQVLNSKNHGVPQNRERVFIVGHIRGTGRPQVFPFSRADEEDTDAGGLYEGDEGRDSQSQNGQKEVQHTRDAHHKSEGDSSRNERGTPSISKTVRSGGRKSPHGSKQNWDSYEVGTQIRRLTPTECERLQGFPDGWTEGVSDTQRYKTLGNAVTVNVIRDIVEKLI